MEKIKQIFQKTSNYFKGAEDDIKKFKVVIIGAGCAGIFASQILSKNKHVDLVVIDRKDYFEYSPSIFNSLSKPKVYDSITIPYEKVFSYAKFIHAEVIKVTENSIQIIRQISSSSSKDQMQSFSSDIDGDLIKFDFLILATGSQQNNVLKPNDSETTIEKRKKSLEEIREEIDLKQNIYVIGSGPVGVEMATHIATYYIGKKITLVTKDDKILGQFSEKAQQQTLDYLTNDLNIKVEFLKTQEDYQFKPSTDLVIECKGNKYETGFLIMNFSKFLDDDGQIYVNEYMQLTSENQDDTMNNVYSIGDAVNLQQISYLKNPYFKVIPFANYTAKIAAYNIQIQIQQRLNLSEIMIVEQKFKKFKEKGAIPIFLISMGKNMNLAIYRRYCNMNRFNFNMKQKINQQNLANFGGSSYHRFSSNAKFLTMELFDTLIDKIF